MYKYINFITVTCPDRHKRGCRRNRHGSRSPPRCRKGGSRVRRSPRPSRPRREKCCCCSATRWARRWDSCSARLRVLGFPWLQSAVVWNPIAVDSIPEATVPDPIAVEPPPEAVVVHPIAVEYSPVAFNARDECRHRAGPRPRGAAERTRPGPRKDRRRLRRSRPRARVRVAVRRCPGQGRVRHRGRGPLALVSRRAEVVCRIKKILHI